MWIYKAIKTTRFNYLVYSNAFGTSIKYFIGKVFNTKLKNDFKREIIEALLINDYIGSVFIIDYEIKYNKIFINLKIETKLNEKLEMSFNV